LIGILIDKKLIQSVEDPVCRYLPEWKWGCRNAITIKHLLTMSAGYKRLGARGVLSKTDMNEFVLQLKPDTLPGLRFSYSNESVQILGLLIERATAMRADDAFGKYLLNSLQMDSTKFMRDSVGNVVVYGGVTTTVRQAHTVGLLMMHKGRFEGKQIVSEQWVKDSVTPSAKAAYYGYLWWLDYKSTYKNYAATGDVGQMTIVFPELELIFVRKQACDQTPGSVNMSWMGPRFLEMIGTTVKH
jgi:CubicO group peptidase (beta-lactamase class C family)